MAVQDKFEVIIATFAISMRAAFQEERPSWQIGIRITPKNQHPNTSLP